MNDDWDNYPEGVLEQALETNEQQLLEFEQRVTCDPDPYNVSFVELVSRWWDRMSM